LGVASIYASQWPNRTRSTFVTPAIAHGYDVPLNQPPRNNHGPVRTC
jgi:hypothetical protein